MRKKKKLNSKRKEEIKFFPFSIDTILYLKALKTLPENP
jgi:hypothetical protein